MEDNNNKEESAGKVNWNQLEKPKREAQKKKTTDKSYDHQVVKNEVEKLSEEERNSPYPDEFLADWNLLEKKIRNGKNRMELNLKDTASSEKTNQEDK